MVALFTEETHGNSVHKEQERSSLGWDDEEDIREARDSRDAVGSETSLPKSDASLMSVFRDFFLAAFSDGYHVGYCCGQEGFFPGGSCFESGRRRVSPAEMTSGRGLESPPQSVGTAYNNRAGSVDSKKRRKKPLAVAVGWNYAEDMHGRPVVITPGRRSSSSRGRISPPASPVVGSTPVISRKEFDLHTDEKGLPPPLPASD